MSDVGRFLETIKRVAKEVIEAGKPCEITYGEVTSINPLTIQISPKLILRKEQLILTDAVRDYSVDVTVNWRTEAAGCYTVHAHAVRGRKRITVHNGLKEGERVVLQRVQGGQMYEVKNRVVNA